MEIDPVLEAQAFEEAYSRFPRFRGIKAKLAAKPLFRGFAWQLVYEEPPPQDPDAWEFQNAVVKTYRRAAGL